MSNVTDIRRAAMNMLARREHSEAELFRKLRSKQYAEDEIRIVLTHLVQEGLLSNSRFLENYIHYRRNRGYGPLRIHAELIERGVSEDLIDPYLNISDNVWLINVRTVWQKRFKGQKPQDFKSRAQQMRFLHYRGFTQDQIESIYQSDN